ncbi:MAG: outer membrane protein assembly factor [Alphaproteobacteria bacterium]|nr:MAG: outer membrane protein assembly factor [Alphaproteobacteria bacterium]
MDKLSRKCECLSMNLLTASARRNLGGIAFAALTLLATHADAAKVALNAGVVPTETVAEIRTTALVFSLEAQAPEDIVAAAQGDYARILSVLYDHGYFGASVSILLDGREAATFSPFEAPARINTVSVRIAPGPIFRLSRAAIRPVPADWRAPAAFHAGQPASTAAMRAAVGSAIDAWRERGHAKARLADQEVLVLHQNRTVDARFRLDPGPRLRFGRLRAPRDSAMWPERLRAIAGLPEGRVFSPSALARSAERLRDTGAFSSVTLREAAQPNADGTLDILASYALAKPRRIGLGAEISSSEGIAVEGFWLHRNLFGGAERVRVDTRVEGLGTRQASDGADVTTTLRFSRPATLDADTRLDAWLAFQRLDDTALDERSTEVGLSLSRFVSARQRAGAGISYRQARFADTLGTRSFSIWSLPMHYEYDGRDDPANARAGSFARLDATPFNASGSAGVRALLDWRRYWSATDRASLAVRVQLGSVLGTSIATTPPDLLFYSGGAGTVRGQPYQSLGVESGSGQTGGRGFLAGSIELRLHGTGRFGGAAFVDYGSVGTGPAPLSNASHHMGAGLGLRYASLAGPIRLDLATPIGANKPADRLFLYIGLGQAF